MGWPGRVGMVPPCPPASAGTGSLGGLVEAHSCEVPDSLGQLNSRKSQLPIRDRHFRTSGPVPALPT